MTVTMLHMIVFGCCWCKTCCKNDTRLLLPQESRSRGGRSIHIYIHSFITIILLYRSYRSHAPPLTDHSLDSEAKTHQVQILEAISTARCARCSASARGLAATVAAAVSDTETSISSSARLPESRLRKPQSPSLAIRLQPGRNDGQMLKTWLKMRVK